MNRFRKTLLGVLLGFFFIFVGAAVFIDQYYFVHLPKAPDETLGLTEKVVVSHGSVRYASLKELRTFQLIQNIFPCAALSFVAAIGLGMKWGFFKVRGSSA